MLGRAGHRFKADIHVGVVFRLRTSVRSAGNVRSPPMLDSSQHVRAAPTHTLYPALTSPLHISCWCVDPTGREIPNTRAYLPYAVLHKCPTATTTPSAASPAAAPSNGKCKIDAALLELVKRDVPSSPRFAATRSNAIFYTAKNTESSGGTRQVFLTMIKGGQTGKPIQVTHEKQSIKGFVPRPKAPSQVRGFRIGSF